ncbi:hypothetical protein V6N11_017884 [Hibiscus sabdariffa]|uniref:Uncharacterized protein n=1 Tax=Hibiscus sabdariffa TaxID=183260 RepID=A0ABR2T6Q6_9ROSI
MRFVCTALAVYVDKTMNTDMYDEMFARMTYPNYQGNVRDLLVFVLTRLNSTSTCAIVNQSSDDNAVEIDNFNDGTFGGLIRSQSHEQFQELGSLY